ncbi:putative F-box protein At1g49610 [Tasmannia lanceolata]|uniref:putative F-box protein At1g49610 n=1 Tax=Tasmannia lanceolata TaxID=3420 RepID=UPI00406457A8
MHVFGKRREEKNPLDLSSPSNPETSKIMAGSRRQETSGIGVEEQNHDQISNLPDYILCHILSFMPTKDAVKTGILSRRWRDLWTWVPTLDFDSRQFVNRGRMDFFNFVDRSLILYECSNIRRFRLSFEHFEGQMASYTDAWIRFAVRRQVEELELDFCCLDIPYVLLPHCLYNYAKLTYLRLRISNIKLNEFICWRSLKVLCLQWMILEEGIFHVILSGCPLLEDLVIDECDLHPSHLNNSTPNLKSLTVKNFRSRNLRLNISAPKLRSLNIFGFIEGTEFSLTDLLSLHEVTLKFKETTRFDWNDRFSDKLKILLETIIHAKFVTICCWCIQVASTWEAKRQDAPSLNCKCLALELEMRKWELPGIVSLLKASPDLETIIISITLTSSVRFDEEFMRTHDFVQSEYWQMQKSPFPCLAHRLKSVEIHGFMGCDRPMKIRNRGLTNRQENQLKLVKFLLKNAMVLEKMTISFSEGFLREAVKRLAPVVKIVEEISGYPRASSQAEILFSYK